MEKSKTAFFLLQAIGEISEDSIAEARRIKKIDIRRFAAIAAAVALIAGLLSAVFFVSEVNAPRGYIELEAGYRVQLTVNKDSKLLSRSSDSARGQAAAERLPVMSPAAEAAGRLVGEMISEKALTEEDNTLLISVSGQIDVNAVREAVLSAFDKAGFDGALLIQTVEPHGQIGEGRKRLIDSVMAQAPDLNRSALEKLSVNDLSLIVSSRGITLDGVTLIGESRLVGVSADKAAASALAYLSAEGKKPILMNACLTCDSGGLYYKVSLSAGDEEYTCAVSVAEGRVESVYIRLPYEEPTQQSQKPTSAIGEADHAASPANTDDTTESGQTSATTQAAANSSSLTAQPSAQPATQAAQPSTQPVYVSASGYLYNRVNASSDSGGSAVYYTEQYTQSFTDPYDEHPKSYDRVALLTSDAQVRDFYDYFGQPYSADELLDELADDFFDKFALVGVVMTQDYGEGIRLTGMNRSNGRLIPRVEVFSYGWGSDEHYPIDNVRFYMADRYFISDVVSVY